VCIMLVYQKRKENKKEEHIFKLARKQNITGMNIDKSISRSYTIMIIEYNERKKLSPGLICIVFFF